MGYELGRLKQLVAAAICQLSSGFWDMKELRWRQKRHDTVVENRERAQFHASGGDVATLAIGALGVVFGDIGTSPLYAIDQIFFASAKIGRIPENILGAISLAIWTITVVVAIKYALAPNYLGSHHACRNRPELKGAHAGACDEYRRPWDGPRPL